MKLSLSIIGILVLIALVIGVWFIPTQKPPQQQPTGSTDTTPDPFYGTREPVRAVPNQQASAGTQPDVARAFYGQQEGADRITLGGTVIASGYALQKWYDENTGGEALLRYSVDKGWELLSVPSGGAWNAKELVDLGIPESVAQALIAGRDW